LEKRRMPRGESQKRKRVRFCIWPNCHLPQRRWWMGVINVKRGAGIEKGMGNKRLVRVLPPPGATGKREKEKSSEHSKCIISNTNGGPPADRSECTWGIFVGKRKGKPSRRTQFWEDRKKKRLFSFFFRCRGMEGANTMGGR